MANGFLISKFCALVEEPLATCASAVFGAPAARIAQAIHVVAAAAVDAFGAACQDPQRAERLLSAVRRTALNVRLADDLLVALDAERAGGVPRGEFSAPVLFGRRYGPLVALTRSKSGMSEAAARRVVEAVALTFRAFLRTEVLRSGMEATDLARRLGVVRAVRRHPSRDGEDRNLPAMSRPFAARPLTWGLATTVLIAVAIGVASPRRVTETDTSALGHGAVTVGERLPETVRAAPAAAPAETIVAVAPTAVAPAVVASTIEPPSPPLRRTVEPMRLLTPAGQVSDAGVAHELASFVASDAGVSLDVKAEPARLRDLAQDEHSPTLTVARYDLLQSLRTRAEASDPAARRTLQGMQVVMPLFTEEIHVVARRDDPLRHIGQIEKTRVNTGPIASDDAFTAEGFYRQMFQHELNAAQETRFPVEEALRRLVEDKTVDVVFVVAGQPSDVLRRTDPAILQRIKFLDVDPTSAATRRAKSRYLMSTLWAANYPAVLQQDVPSFAVLSFLIASRSDDPRVQQRLTQFAGALCERLGVLRARGHPKWREVQPSFQVDTGLPALPALVRDASGCSITDRSERASISDSFPN